MGRLVLVFLVCVLAFQTRQYADAWTTNETLFALAADRAPQKPRPLIFYGLTLVAQGRWNDAHAIFLRVERTQGSPRWDRAWPIAGRRNRQALEQLGRRYGYVWE